MYFETDFIVIGSGVAGLRASIALAETGGRVTVLTKDKASESNTEYAQGGVAVVLSDDDEAELHEEDTVTAGAGLCDERAVETLVSEGTRYVKELIEWGTAFDRDGGKLVFTQEAAHSRRRILHAHGDSTGAEIVRSLIGRARQEKSINLLPFANTESLILNEGRCVGVRFLDDLRRLRGQGGAVLRADPRPRAHEPDHEEPASGRHANARTGRDRCRPRVLVHRREPDAFTP